MTSHRERKSVVACCVKSGARVFSGVVLTTPSAFTAIAGGSALRANRGGVFADTAKSAVLNSRDSPFIGVCDYSCLKMLRAPQAESDAWEIGGVRGGGGVCSSTDRVGVTRGSYRIPHGSCDHCASRCIWRNSC